MARFQNKSRALDQLTLIPICPNSSNDGRLATPQLRSCTGNSSPMATRISITESYRRLARYFPGEQKKRYTRGVPSGQKKQEVADQLPQPPVLARQAMFLFASPGLKNAQMKNKRRSLSCGLCILKSIKRMSWSSSLLTCCARAQENSSMIGSAV